MYYYYNYYYYQQVLIDLREQKDKNNKIKLAGFEM